MHPHKVVGLSAGMAGLAASAFSAAWNIGDQKRIGTWKRIEAPDHSEHQDASRKNRHRHLAGSKVGRPKHAKSRL